MSKIPFTKATDCFTLSNGVKIPCLGYGTWQTPNGGVTEKCVVNAINAGYRHIDTAFIYGNEQEVGSGIRLSGAARSDIFLTTKHWVTERGYEKTLAAVETSLKNLGTDYIDLYLIHWPCVQKISEDWEKINADTWRGFERAYKDGKIRAIGVSNFQKKHIDALIKYAEVKPMVNQLEFHPGYTQLENVRAMQEMGVLTEAWSPMGSGAVLKDERLASLAAKYGVSVSQLCVRFALQENVLPLPKSTNENRMAQNMKVFDFEISEEDISELESFPLLGFSGFMPEDAPADALAE
ncbi:MAG: aldo/keto reductase [Clostridia bacterium]|nr:aldo/keto reductase [Clostridia bacterium]